MQSLGVPSVEHTPGTATTIKAPTPQRPANIVDMERESQEHPPTPNVSLNPPRHPTVVTEPPSSRPSTRFSFATPSEQLSPLYSPEYRHLYRGPDAASWGEESQQIFNEGVLEYAEEHPSIFEFFLPGDREPTERERYVAERRGMFRAREIFYANQTATRESIENMKRVKRERSLGSRPTSRATLPSVGSPPRAPASISELLSRAPSTVSQAPSAHISTLASGQEVDPNIPVVLAPPPRTPVTPTPFSVRLRARALPDAGRRLNRIEEEQSLFNSLRDVYSPRTLGQPALYVDRPLAPQQHIFRPISVAESLASPVHILSQSTPAGSREGRPTVGQPPQQARAAFTVRQDTPREEPMYIDPHLDTIQEEQVYQPPRTVQHDHSLFVRAETVSSASHRGPPGGPPSSHSSPSGGGGGGGGWPPRGGPPTPPGPGDGGAWPPAPPPPPGQGGPGDEYPGGGAPGGGPPGGDPPSGYYEGQFGHDPHSQRPIIVYVQQPERERAHRPKAREPDRFSGKDTAKVQTFILQCTLYFQNDIEAYAEDYKKINTAISYFEDLALNWITPFLLVQPRPSLLQNWGEFVRTLHDMFGDRDIMLVAQSKIEHLRMADNHHAPRYIIEFAQWAPLTGYNEIALMKQFYDGLPERLKDKISELEPSETFADLRILTQRLDARYWRRQFEKEPARRQQTKSGEKPKETKPASTSASASGTTANKTTEAKPKNKLNSAGRLSDEERKRRMENKLCLYCAAPDHIRANCPSAPPMNNNPKPSSDAPKPAANAPGPRVGRVVLTVPAEPSASIEQVEESTPEAAPDASENK